jgi:hypothetical protein
LAVRCLFRFSLPNQASPVPRCFATMKVPFPLAHNPRCILPSPLFCHLYPAYTGSTQLIGVGILSHQDCCRHTAVRSWTLKCTRAPAVPFIAESHLTVFTAKECYGYAASWAWWPSWQCGRQLLLPFALLCAPTYRAPAIIMNWPKGSSYEGTLEAWAGNGGAKERVEAKQEGKSK